jgi:hypothetical protein
MDQYTVPDYLLVAPDFKDEVLGKQGEIGLVAFSDFTDDTIFLRFEDGQLGAYPSEALLSLKSSKEIYDYLEWNAMDISKKDFRTLHNLTLFLDYGDMAAQKKALVIARESPLILEASTTRLNEALDQIHSRRFGR